jgi:phage N-6-adenine-methyltransferase
MMAPAHKPHLFWLASATSEWSTPPDLFETLDKEFHFDLDPCSTHENTKCTRHYTAEDNGLLGSWFGNVFMNPPYGREIGLWVQKAFVSAAAGATVVCLLPANTDTSWFHDYCLRGEIRFLRGRLGFGGTRKGGAPFASMIVIFRPQESGR